MTFEIILESEGRTGVEGAVEDINETRMAMSRQSLKLDEGQMVAVIYYSLDVYIEIFH